MSKAILHRPLPVKRVQRRFIYVAVLLAPIAAQNALAADSGIPDYSQSGRYFPQIFRPYLVQQIPPLPLHNTKSLTDLIQDGRIELSLRDLIGAVVENNLDIAAARYNYFMAQTDLLRAKSGQAARGVPGVVIPDQIFAGALGSGTGAVAAAGGIGATGSITGQVRSLNLQPAGLYDPYLIVNASWDRTTSPLNSTAVSGVPAVTPATTFFSFYFQQAFTQGGNINISVNSQRQSSTQLGLLYDPDVITRISLSFVQPLVNGAGFAFNRIFLTVARNDLDIAKEIFRQQVATTLAQAENSYWDLVAAQQAVGAAEKALDAAKQLDRENRVRAKVGVLAQADADSAAAQVSARERDSIVARTTLQIDEITLKNFLTREITEDLGAAQITATDPLPEPDNAAIPALDQAVASALDNRPELREAQGNVKNQDAAVEFTHNGLRPTVNAFGLFALAGLSGNRATFNALGIPVVQSGGALQELTQVLHVDYPEIAFGISVGLPIRNRAAQADHARAQINKRQADVAVQQTKKSIRLDVRNAILNLTQAAAQVRMAHNAADFSQQTLDAERKKLAAGVSTPYNVTLAVQGLFSAQLALVQAQSIYAKALVAREQSTGTLLETSHVSLEQMFRLGGF